MPEKRNGPRPKFFANAAAFREWLEKHSSTARELIVGFHKVGTGKPSIKWAESVDEALCFGWIDGVRHRIDGSSYQIRFAPRQEDSIWSAVNIARAEALEREGRMTKAGREAFARRTERRSTVYSYEQEGALTFSPEERGRFQANPRAWDFFTHAAPSYQRTSIFWVVSAKQDATRERRLTKLIEACAAGEKLMP